MTAYFCRRLLLMIPTLLGVTIIAFVITRFVPGGPLERRIMEMQMGGAVTGEGGATGGRGSTGPQGVSEEQIEQLKKQFDLDKPVHIAYLRWLGRIVRFDLGESYNFHKPVWELISERLPISLTFGLTGFLLAYLISIPLGIFKATKHGTYFDFTSSAVVFVGYSIPGWALGALLLLVFASGRFYDVMPLGGVKSSSYSELPDIVQEWEPQKKVSDTFGTFVWEKMSVPSKLFDTLWHMFLPVFCYMIGSFAALTVLTKNSLMENLGQDYVRTAFAKGLAPRRVIFMHTLRNSLIPLATGLGHALSIVMAGSYLIEVVFDINGIGYLGFISITGRDYTVVMGILTINTALILLGNILSDILYALIDPRIRFE